MFIISEERGSFDWELPRSLTKKNDSRVAFEQALAPHVEWFTTRLVAACMSENRNELLHLLEKLEIDYDAEASGIITKIVA